MKLFYACLSVFLCNILMAVDQAKPDEQKLDLYGDGIQRAVTLPFTYYHTTPEEKKDLIHQGGYKVYDLKTEQDHVVIVGTLKPCIGIVASDGNKLIAFHKHYTNALSSMAEIMEKNLDFSAKENIYVRIYTARDDVIWKQGFAQVHGNIATVFGEIINIQDFLRCELSIPKKHIVSDVYNTRDEDENFKYEDYAFGWYELSELCIGIPLKNWFNTDKKEIRFYSIDPFQEDLFGLRGKDNFIDSTYEKRPIDSLLITRLQSRFKFLTGLLNKEEAKLYKRQFKKTMQEVIGSSKYNELPFYQI